MKHFIVGWEFKDGKIITTMNNPNIIHSDDYGNYSTHYYKMVWTDYYGLLEDDFDRCDGDKLTGLSYKEWIKTIDYDDIIKRCAGRYNSRDVVRKLLGVSKSNNDDIPF